MQHNQVHMKYGQWCHDQIPQGNDNGASEVQAELEKFRLQIEETLQADRSQQEEALRQIFKSCGFHAEVDKDREL